MYKITFENLSADITKQEYESNSFDVNFSGQMLVRFERKEGKIIATNGMNVCGVNIAQEIGGKEPKIEALANR